MRYIVYVDWENMWYEHVQRSFPGVPLKTADAGAAMPVVTAIAAPHVERLRRFPQDFAAVLTNTFDHAPIAIVSAAIWADLPFRSHVDFETELRQATNHPYRVSTPKLKPKSAKAPALPWQTKAAKNSSDYHLTFEIIKGSFLCDATNPAHHSNLDAIVIMSGDHIFGQFIDFVEDTSQLSIVFLSHIGCLHGSMIDAVRDSKGRAQIRRLEKSTSYRALQEDWLSIDELHKHKKSNPSSFDQILTASVVKRVSESSKKELRVYELRNWINNWLDYWSKECGMTRLKDEGRCIAWLEQKDFVHYDKRSGSREAKDYRTRFVRLNRKNARHLYSIPPVYYRGSWA
jgi:hypothetical protein